jgi:hypothetical protein
MIRVVSERIAQQLDALRNGFRARHSAAPHETNEIVVAQDIGRRIRKTNVSCPDATYGSSRICWNCSG